MIAERTINMSQKRDITASVRCVPREEVASPPKPAPKPVVEEKKAEAKASDLRPSVPAEGAAFCHPWCEWSVFSCPKYVKPLAKHFAVP